MRFYKAEYKLRSVNVHQSSSEYKDKYGSMRIPVIPCSLSLLFRFGLASCTLSCVCLPSHRIPVQSLAVAPEHKATDRKK